MLPKFLLNWLSYSDKTTITTLINLQRINSITITIYSHKDAGNDGNNMPAESLRIISNLREIPQL